MYSKKIQNKPKSNIRGTPTPTPQPHKAVSPSPNLHSNQEQIISPSKAKATQIKKPINRDQPIRIIKPIQQIETISNSDSQLVGSQIEKQELLQLQIKHLKRENLFLKKKIQELVAQEQMYYPKKKNVNKNKGYQSPNIQSLQLNVKYFFKQINNLLNSITKIFKINIQNPTQQNKIQIQKQQCPIQRQFLFKKYILNRKLQKIALEDEEKRYPSLLQIFTEYYTYKEQAQQKILLNLDAMILKTNELNKELLSKAQIKKFKSQVYSISNKQSNQTEKGFTYQFLKPIQAHNRLTFSPNPKNAYKRNTDLSP